jgi:fatty acid desaturase
MDDAAKKVSEIRTEAPLALNFPVFVAQLPYIAVSPAKREWVPKGMPPNTWRALSWPFVGILFWWFLGRGIEALRTARRSVVYPRIRWIETAVALILLATGLVTLIGILTTTPDDRSDLQFMTLLAGGLLWGILATVTITARLLQWRVAKRNAAAQATTDASPG